MNHLLLRLGIASLLWGKAVGNANISSNECYSDATADLDADLYLDFDADQLKSRICYDEAQNIEGTIGSGVTTVPSVIPAGDGVSFYFDGNSNSTVEVDPTAKFNFFEDRTFSISFWAKPIANQPTVAVVSASQSTQGVSVLCMDTNEWSFLMETGDAEHYLTGGSCGPGTPQYVVATYDATSQVAQLYVNGNLTANETVPSYSATNTPLVVGGGYVGLSNYTYFNGSVDGVSVFPFVLDGEDVALLYQSGFISCGSNGTTGGGGNGTGASGTAAVPIAAPTAASSVAAAGNNSGGRYEVTALEAREFKLRGDAYKAGQTIYLNELDIASDGQAIIGKYKVDAMGIGQRETIITFDMFIGDYEGKCKGDGMMWGLGDDSNCLLRTQDQDACNGVAIGFNTRNPSKGIHITVDGERKQYIKGKLSTTFWNKWTPVKIFIDRNSTNFNLTVHVNDESYFDEEVTFTQAAFRNGAWPPKMTFYGLADTKRECLEDHVVRNVVVKVLREEYVTKKEEQKESEASENSEFNHPRLSSFLAQVKESVQKFLAHIKFYLKFGRFLHRRHRQVKESVQTNLARVDGGGAAEGAQGAGAQQGAQQGAQFLLVAAALAVGVAAKLAAHRRRGRDQVLYRYHPI